MMLDMYSKPPKEIQELNDKYCNELITYKNKRYKVRNINFCKMVMLEPLQYENDFYTISGGENVIITLDRLEELIQEQHRKEDINMRDRNRIEPFMKLFKELWLRNPDMRFGQLVYDTTCKIRSDGDMFNIEDDEMLKEIKLELFDKEFVDYLNRI